MVMVVGVKPLTAKVGPAAVFAAAGFQRTTKPAVNAVAAGERVLAPGLLASTPEHDAEMGRLTNREKQILQLIAEGKSNKEIAQLLELSVNTVSVHRANLMEALGIHRTAELVLYAVRKGLVRIP